MSDTNNNIPTRITQLEEATEYEDGMFYAVAKAGRGTYKIPVDEMTPNEQALSDKIENEIVPAVENSFAYGTVDESEIASFPDGSELPLKVLEIAVEPQQDLHGYDSPWVGGAGKNKANPDLLLNGYTNPSNRKYDDTAMAKTQFVKTEGLSTITISATNGNRCYVCYYNDIPNVGDEASTNVTQVATSLPQTITVDSSYTYVAIQVSYNPSGANASNVQVESGSTATTFAPYSNICPISGWDEANVTVADATTDPTVENIYTIDLNGTRYGGKVDLVSGVLTVDRAYVDLGTLTWTYNTSSSLNPFFYAPISGIKSYGAPYNVAINAMSSLYKIVRRTEADFVDGCLCGDGTATTILQIQVKDSRFTDAVAFKTAMNGVQLVYELATPIEIQLTPTQVKSLKGYNNISADTGNILKVEYIRDLDIVINSLLERIAALEG